MKHSMESTKEKKNLLEFVNVELSLIGEGQYVISVVFILDDITNPMDRSLSKLRELVMELEL